MGNVRDRAVDLAYAAGWSVAGAVPERLVRKSFSVLADQTWARDGDGVRRLSSNLARVVDPNTSPAELAELTRLSMQSYMRYWRETFSLAQWSREEVLSRIHVVNPEVVQTLVDDDRGLVIALSHSGNWDLGGAWLGIAHGAFTTVAERLKPEALFERFKAHRESLGMEILAADGGPRVLATMKTRLREGGIVCLLADRDLSGNGIPVNFFGAPAHFPAGPAALATSTGAALLTVRFYYKGEQMAIEFDEPLREVLPATAPRHDRIQVLTQQMADAFQANISAHPTDWHMMQPFWDEDRGLL